MNALKENILPPPKKANPELSIPYINILFYFLVKHEQKR